MHTIDDLLVVMQRLRDKKNGCPWDKKQTMQSLMPYTLEETYELLDAIVADDTAQIKEELGDVLFQTIFYSQIAQETEKFTFAQVIDELTAKLIRRHGHVFTEQAAIDEAQIKQRWEQSKQQEREAKQQISVLDDIPRALPALKRAQKIQKRVANVGFDWPEASAVFSKINEEIAELNQAIAAQDKANMAEELGDLLFCCVNLARHLQIDAETALEQSNQKFIRRFRFIEERLAEQNKTPEQSHLLEMGSLWQQAKAQEKA